jgi:hypothetical protein
MHRLGVDSAYVLRSGAVGLITLVLLAIGFSAGAGLLIVGVGVPVVAATLGVARWFAGDERRWIGMVLGRRLADPPYRRASPDASVARRLLVVLADRQAWRDAAHGLLRAVPGIAGLSLMVTWFAGAVAGLTAPLWGTLSLSEVQTIGRLLFTGGGAMPVLTDIAAGVFFAVTFVPLVHVIAVSSATFSRALVALARDSEQ